MARLIDADRALEIVRDQGIAHPNAYYLTNYATLILREAPTVDAVKVVRCRDCKHLVLTAEGEHNPCDCVCDYWMTDGLNDNDFCSHGERKDGDVDAWKEKDGGDGG